ncbi:MAG: hypothetical protein ACOC33_00180 [bacterium]
MLKTKILSNTELLKKIQECSDKFEKQKKVILQEYDKLEMIEKEYVKLMEVLNNRK